jgi:hypothetical protein
VSTCTPRSAIRRWKPRFVAVTPPARRRDGGREPRDLIAVDLLGALVDGQHAVAVPVEGHPRSSEALVTSCCKCERSVAPQPTLMFDPSGSTPIARTWHRLLEDPRRERGHRSVAQSTPIRSPVRSVPQRSRRWAA